MTPGTSNGGRLARRLGRRVRTALRPASETYREGTEPVAIDDLISPLRYDVLVRERHLALLRELGPRPTEDLVAASRGTPYHLWFERIVVPTFFPRLAGDAEQTDAAFAERVAASADLLRRFEAGGFDRRHPITLRTGTTIQPTETGKRLRRTLYAGDGCHRLALLRLGGARELEPGTYRVSEAASYRPRDNTAILLRHLSVPEAEYAAFLSLSYATEPQRTLTGLLEHVAAHRADDLGELRRVIAHDQPLLRGVEVRS